MLRILKFIKDYLSIIVLIPTLLGALFQIFNIIFYVGLPYIRYFSASQLIPDGILIIFLIFFLIIIYILILFFKFQYEDLKSNYLEDKGIYEISTFIFFSIFLILLPFSIYKLYNHSLQNDIISLYSHFFSQVILTLNISLLFLYLNEVINIKIDILNNTMLINYTRKVIFFITTLFSTYLLLNLINTLYISNEMIVQSKDLYNFRKLKEKFKQEGNIDNIKILYLNRDYIFCEVSTSFGKEIAIIEQKELLSIFPKKGDDEDK